MPAGLTIFNTAGTVQVDQLYRNLALAAVAIVSTGPAYVGSSYSIASFTISGTAPTVALRCSVSACVEYVDRSGSSWTFYIRANSPTAVTVTYYVFDVIATMPTTYGFEVRDDTGNPVFHSALKYMRVVDAIKGKSAGQYGNRVYDTSRVYAWVTSVTPMYSFSSAGLLENRITGASAITGGVSIGKIVLSSIPAGGGAEPYDFSGLVLDVTNY